MNRTSSAALVFAMLAVMTVIAPVAAADSATIRSHVQVAAAVGEPNHESVPSAVEPLTWSVFRVTLSSHGDIEGIRMVYHSAGAAFNRAALRAVSSTTFVAESPSPTATTFDYMLMLENGKRRARIMGHVPGQRETSLLPNVRIPQRGEAWLSDQDRCSISKG